MLDRPRGGGNQKPATRRSFFQLRDENRQLPAERVLDLARRWMPRQYELAEVVGQWIWIKFPEAPEETVRAQLSQFGFHWNNVRKCWQHPCGHVTTGTPKEPREKYESYFPADLPSNPQTYNGPARTAEQVAA